MNRILRINIDDFAEWPESVRSLAIAIAEELFLVAYNPFIDADTVRDSVRASYDKESVSWRIITPRPSAKASPCSGRRMRPKWSSGKSSLMPGDVLPAECILTNLGALVESATDATDLRMELPCCKLSPTPRSRWPNW